MLKLMQSWPESDVLLLCPDVRFTGELCCPQALEERFNAMIEPAISGALAARHADRVANLAMLMANAGREHELEGLYIAARLPMLQVTT